MTSAQPPTYNDAVQQKDQQNRSVSEQQVCPDETQSTSSSTQVLCYEKAIQWYQAYLREMMKKKRKYFHVIIVPIMICISLARFIAGSFKLDSDCDEEFKVAVCCFIKAILGLVYHITIMGLVAKGNLERSSENRFIQLFILILRLPSLILLLLGTVWVLDNYSNLVEVCKSTVEDWDRHFINFIMFLTVLDWVITVAFVIVSGIIIGAVRPYRVRPA